MSEEFENEGELIEASAIVKPVKVKEEEKVELIGPPIPVDFTFTRKVVEVWISQSWARLRGVYSIVMLEHGAVPVPEYDPEGKYFDDLLSVVARFVVNSVNDKGEIVVPEEYAYAPLFLTLEEIDKFAGYLLLKKN